MTLKKPEECNSAEDVRNEIDKIDHEIIKLYGERHKYVEEIVRFKNDEEGIIAKERKRQVIQDRRKWATENGLDADTFEKMYNILIENNIKRELEILKLKQQKQNLT
jgi:isochorismate pyruvate lyase